MQFLPRIRPIDLWPGKETVKPKRSTFRAKYGDTKARLIFELKKLNVVESSLLLGMYVDADDIKLVGNELRANARPRKPGVILTFTREISRTWNDQALRYDRKTLDLSYPCDAFDDWQDNVRAIALSLEALRRVARYGVFSYDTMAERLALPSAAGKTSTADDAFEFLGLYSEYPASSLPGNSSYQKAAYRQAAARLHPDKFDGDETLWHRLQDVKKFLGL